MRVRTGIIAALAMMAFLVLVGFSDNQSPSSANEEGRSFDCEPLVDGVDRWLNP